MNKFIDKNMSIVENEEVVARRRRRDQKASPRSAIEDLADKK